MRRLLVLVAIPLILTACGGTSSRTPSATPSTSPPSPVPASRSGPPPASSSPTPSASSGRSALLFRVAQAGGFIAPSADLVALPLISIYSDGTIIAPGTANTADPAPALPAIAREAVDAASLAKIVEAAKATGLGDPQTTFDGGPTPDEGVTLITIDLGGAVRHLRIMSLGDEMRDAGLDPKVIAARVKLRAFLASMGDMPSLVGAGLTTPPAPYVADRVMLVVTPGSPASGGSGPAVAWPLAAPLAAFGATLAAAGGGGTNPGGLNGGGEARCGVISGSDLATLTPLLSSATTLTGWTSAGATFTVAVRPLLPDEAGCPSS